MDASSVAARTLPFQGPRFEALDRGPVRSFRMCDWAGMLDGRLCVDWSNAPSALMKVRFVRIGALQQALRQLMRRHTILQSHLEEREGAPWIIRSPDREIPLEFLDFNELSEDLHTHERVEKAIGEVVWRPFDIYEGPLFRIFVVRCGRVGHYIGLVAHHFLADRYSAGVLVSELVQLHDALVRRQPSRLAAVRLRYEDYLHGMNEWVCSDSGLVARRAFIERVAEHEPVDFGPFEDRSQRTSDYFAFDPDVSVATRLMARKLGTSVFVVLLAAQNILLHSLGRTAGAMIEISTSGREASELSRLIGNMADSQYVFTPISETSTFQEAVLRSHAALGQSRRTGFVSGDIQKIDMKQYGISVSAPLFSFTPVLPRNTKQGEAGSVPALRIPPLDAPLGETQSGYHLEIFDSGDDLRGRIRYGRGQIKGFLEALERVLRDGSGVPETKVFRFFDYLELAQAESQN